MTTISEALAIAIEHHQAGRLAEAEHIYRQILLQDENQPAAWHLLGLIAHQVGQHSLAVDYISRAIQQNDRESAYFYNLGNIFKSQGNFPSAIACYQRALELKPDYIEAHNNLGTALRELGECKAAIASYQRAVELNPNFVDAHFNLGVLFRQLGDIGTAINCLSEVIELQPDHTHSLITLGEAYLEQLDFTAAIACFKKALDLQPDRAEAYYNLGTAYQRHGDWDSAVNLFERALELRPAYPEAYNHLGLARKDQGKLAEAITCYQRALELNPDFAEAHNNLGVVMHEKGNIDAAITCFTQAAELRPDWPDAHFNLGTAHQQRSDLRNAMKFFQRAIELRPNYPEAHHSLGDVQLQHGELDAAIASFDRALELKPDYFDAQFNRAFTLLLAGDWERGWPAYECRWQHDDNNLRHTSRPLWNGESLAGKTILLYTEQGLGDAIQFIRYAAVVKKLGGTVIVECHKPLRSLLASCPGIDHLITQGETPPEFDLQAPLMSLPRILKQTLKDIPQEIPYLSARPDLCDRWREKLRDITGFKVGVAWQGGRVYIKDRFRSFPLQQFAPLAQLPNVHLISLQTGFGTEQLAEARQQFPIIDFGEELDQESGPFMDTAAVMKNLDLVITPDTATAHLAGALGVPVWVALSFAPDWRNMLHRTDSPWYPTMRLFRQTDFGHWPSVFEQMSHALRERL